MDLLFKIKQAILQIIKDNSRLNDFKIKSEQVQAFNKENIVGNLNDFNINPYTQTLCVYDSGDQLFNLGVKEIKNVDLIDDNLMTEYYALGIKTSLVLVYSYEDYKKVINFLFRSNNYDLELERKILYGLLPFMNFKYKMFFKELFNFYFILQDVYHAPVKLMQIITKDYIFNIEEIIFNNLYLQNEENYNKLKSHLKQMRLAFQFGNIFEIDAYNKYDLMICSDRATQAIDGDKTKLKDSFSKLKNSLTDTGIIASSYTQDFYDRIKANGGVLENNLEDNNTKSKVLILRKEQKIE